ncbi:hypothetical protein ACJX0J_013574 [Zea mays]
MTLQIGDGQITTVHLCFTELLLSKENGVMDLIYLLLQNFAVAVVKGVPVLAGETGMRYIVLRNHRLHFLMFPREQHLPNEMAHYITAALVIGSWIHLHGALDFLSEGTKRAQVIKEMTKQNTACCPA